MNQRTEHLIALVKDGASLKDAARVYGLSGERVRQILEEEEISANEPQERRAATRGSFAVPCHSELTEAGEVTLSAELTEAADGTLPARGLSPADLRSELERFRAELRAGGLRESTIHSYLMGSRLFVRWLAGDYVPGPRRADREEPVHRS